MFVSSGYISSSALNTVLLVVLEQPSIFLAAVICTVSSCFTKIAFPSDTSPANSNFGTIGVYRGAFWRWSRVHTWGRSDPHFMT